MANDLIAQAFAGAPNELEARTARLLAQPTLDPALRQLLGDIAAFVVQLRQPAQNGLPIHTGVNGLAQQSSVNGHAVSLSDADQPTAKRRRVDAGSNEAQSARSHALSASWNGPTFDHVSFAVPVRKKLTLQLGDSASQGVRAVNPTNGQTEAGSLWAETAVVLVLPVPEKAQAAQNFCIIPRLTSSADPSITDAGHPPSNLAAGTSEDTSIATSSGASPATPAQPEALVWTAADTRARGEDESVLTPAAKMLAALRQASPLQVLVPEDAEFVSALQSAVRKGEKTYQIKAFRGSKEGFLFLLATGIFFGFKKPLLFFPFSEIQSVSYTSVLQRTFNLNIAITSSDATATTTSSSQTEADGEPSITEHEFSMIDQADFAGIDAYVKRHGLQDASMAAERRAKWLGINQPGRGSGTANGGAEGHGQGPAGIREDGQGEESELAKAEREAERVAQDDEDDEDEDENFDPGSEGDSDGSGESSEDDDDDDGGTAGRSGGGRRTGQNADASVDLVAEELGSEAEEIEEDDEDEGEEVDEAVEGEEE